MKKGSVSAISTLVGAIFGAVAGTLATLKASDNTVEKTKNLSDKHLALFMMMNQWVKVKQEGKNLSEYFEKQGYKKIAIYGMSYAGETLVSELENTSVQILYGIDKNADSIYANIDVFSIEDSLEEVDAVIVTAITFFDEIEEELSTKFSCPIISLENVLYEI